ncbi:MAG: LacI family DNA-binding transcriptional regulator [Burkholderiaceae bacterium]|nr:LacI family DNA-binding transcriptional regulator [Burkholderiaceae bacterium]
MSSTVKDVAKLAGVSATTVSLVMNGKSGISGDTRTRVMQAAKTLKYSKRCSKVSKDDALGTLCFLKIAKHGHTVNRDHNTFISDYIDGMAREASTSGYKLVIASFEGESVENIVTSLASTQVDGFVVLGTELTEQDIRLLKTLTPPLVVIDSFFDVLDCNFVNMNNKDAVFKIIGHFVERGFKNIGFIASNVQTVNFQLRREAFVEGMKSLGLAFSTRDIVTVDSTFEGAYQDMLTKLNNGLVVPECYFCTNDIITYGCIKALRECNVRIPQDLSVIGFDNLPMSATMDPALTTIDVSKTKIGYLAIRLLDELINSQESQPPLKILVGANLVVRDSVAAYVK